MLKNMNNYIKAYKKCIKSKTKKYKKLIKNLIETIIVINGWIIYKLQFA